MVAYMALFVHWMLLFAPRATRATTKATGHMHKVFGGSQGGFEGKWGMVLSLRIVVRAESSSIFGVVLV